MLCCTPCCSIRPRLLILLLLLFIQLSIICCTCFLVQPRCLCLLLVVLLPGSQCGAGGRGLLLAACADMLQDVEERDDVCGLLPAG
jgi:hypothetical protein